MERCSQMKLFWDSVSFHFFGIVSSDRATWNFILAEMYCQYRSLCVQLVPIWISIAQTIRNGTQKKTYLTYKTAHFIQISHTYRVGTISVVNSPELSTMDHLTPLKVRCGIWHPAVSSRSFKVPVGPLWVGHACSAHPTHARFDRDLGNLEAESTPQTCWN